LFLVCYYRAQS